jgi:hypothetical protein
MDFDHKISNLSFHWINPHNAHHTKAMQTQYYRSYIWILFYAWSIQPTNNFLGSQILIMPTITGIDIFYTFQEFRLIL